ncbi:MAG: endonuclease/exonuclease/phosphatase family protein [Solirubrobacteraceae bacterium]
MALAATAAVVFPAPGLARAALHESPPGQALVVDANLQEAFQLPDVEDPTDVRNFVRAIGEHVPYRFAPDVVLLQEIRRGSAQNVADALGEAYGHRYAIAVDPGETPWVVDGARRDTTVVYDATTMRVEGDGGFVRTTNREGEEKDNAHALLEERRGGLRVPVISLHWAHRGDPVAHARDMVALLDAEYPSPSRRQVEVVAGDFNVKRCVGGPSWKTEELACPQQAWYELFTAEHGFTDAVLSASPEEIPQAQRDDVARIDFLFARGAVLDAGSDLATKRELGRHEQCAGVNDDYFKPGRGSQAPEPCRSLFYTDHRLVWGLVGMPTSPY